MAMAMNVAPSGLPTSRRRVLPPSLLVGVRRSSRREEEEGSWFASRGRMEDGDEEEDGSELVEVEVLSVPGVMELLRRKSCVTAMPMDAKASDVRSQARNVLSVGQS